MKDAHAAARGLDPRQSPDDALIARLRQRYPTEAEIDRVLTRKMRARGAAPYAPVGLPQMLECLRRFLSQRLDQPFSVHAARWMTGGSSKLQMAFELDWHGPDGRAGQQRTPMVLRMSPAESIVETSRRREFQIIRALAGRIAVPRCYWEDEMAEVFPHPALIFGFVDGVAKPASDTSQQVTGLGINYGVALRPAVTQAFMRDLACFHTADVHAVALDAFEIPRIGSDDGIRKQLNMWQRIWDEDRGEAEPLMQLASDWLDEHAPPLDHISVVHGDCRSGNFLISPDDGRITAWLDWELAVLGDRHQDLTWATSLAYSHMAEDGRTLLVNGMLPLAEFYAAYERASGLSVDPRRVSYYRVYNAWVAAIVCCGTAYRVARGGKSHQDVVLTWLNGIGGMLMEQLRQTLLEVSR